MIIALVTELVIELVNGVRTTNSAILDIKVDDSGNLREKFRERFAVLWCIYMNRS